MNTVRTTITVEREDEEIEVECVFCFHPASRGQRDSCGGVPGAGPPLEPDEPASLDFECATAGGVDIGLTKYETEQAEEQLWQQREKDRF